MSDLGTEKEPAVAPDLGAVMESILDASRERLGEGTYARCKDLQRIAKSKGEMFGHAIVAAALLAIVGDYKAADGLIDSAWSVISNMGEMAASTRKYVSALKAEADNG